MDKYNLKSNFLNLFDFLYYQHILYKFPHQNIKYILNYYTFHIIYHPIQKILSLDIYTNFLPFFFKFLNLSLYTLNNSDNFYIFYSQKGNFNKINFLHHQIYIKNKHSLQNLKLFHPFCHPYTKKIWILLKFCKNDPLFNNHILHI